MKLQFATEIETPPGHFNCFGVDLRPGYPLHSHDNHEFFLCAKGTGVQRTDAASYEMRLGDLFFFGRGVMHACTPAQPTGCRSMVVNIDKETFASTLQGDRDAGLILNRLIEFTGNTNNSIVLSPKGRERVHALFADMVQEFWQKAPGYECAVKVRIQEMLLVIMRDPKMAGAFERVFAPVRSEERLRDVLHFLERHFQERITVESIASMACMSRSHLHAVFRAATGKTLTQYINELRSEAAATMLRETDRPITHIAYDCGFPCVSHFYHIFKKAVGVSPRQFRLGREGERS